MKKLVIMLLTIFIIFTFCACSNNSTKEISTTANNALAEEDRQNDGVFEKELSRVPEEYLKPSENSTPSVEVSYTHNDHTKSAVVYLPPNSDESQNYNVLYLLGGVNSDQYSFFHGAGSETALKNILDNMIMNGDIEPCIVANLAFYPSKDVTLDNADLSYLLEDFNEELRDVIIPTIETKFSTYANSVAVSDLVDSRAHRAFSGFSMGGAVCWCTLAEDLDYFNYFAPMAAGSFEDSDNDFKGSIGDALENEMNTLGYNNNAFFVFACEGTEDVTYDKMNLLIKRYKKKYSHIFIFTDTDKSQGNITYKIKQGAEHSYDNAYEYLYNSLQSFWG